MRDDANVLKGIEGEMLLGTTKFACLSSAVTIRLMVRTRHQNTNIRSHAYINACPDRVIHALGENLNQVMETVYVEHLAIDFFIVKRVGEKNVSVHN